MVCTSSLWLIDKPPIGTYWNEGQPETTWKNLKRPETTYNEQETTWNDLQRARNDLKWPITTCKEQETTWNDLQRARNDPQQVRHKLQWLEHAYNEQRKDTKRPTTSRFWDYFTIWDKRFSSLTRFPPNIWLQSFEHCSRRIMVKTEHQASIIMCQSSIIMCIFYGI